MIKIIGMIFFLWGILNVVSLGTATIGIVGLFGHYKFIDIIPTKTAYVIAWWLVTSFIPVFIGWFMIKIVI